MFNQIKDVSLEAVAGLLAFFYALPVVGGSYGVAIMLLTAAVMILLMPLTVRATRSTIKMTQLQPELRKLQKEHKDDKQELNQAMMALYQENGVNPVGGCLPMLAQLPVFLILFNVLRGLTRRVRDDPYYAVSERARELTGAEPDLGLTFDPKYLDRSSELYQDLSADTQMRFGPFDLAVDAWDVVQNDFLNSLPYILLILFVVGSSYYQQRQVSARRGAVPDNPTPQQQTQQQLLRILPLMSGVWSFLFPAGLVLYWATSNLFRIGQQAYITRALYRGDGPGAEAAKALADAESDDELTDSGGGGKPEAGKASAGKAGAAKGGAKNRQPGGRGKPKGESGKASADGRSGRKAASGASKNGAGGGRADSSSGNGSAGVDRDEAWARRRAQRTKAKTTKKKTSTDGSSRTTPKGTKPSAAKKKRKR